MIQEWLKPGIQYAKHADEKNVSANVTNPSNLLQQIKDNHCSEIHAQIKVIILQTL